MSAETRQNEDRFELYDLLVVVERIEGRCTCPMQVGSQFSVKGGAVIIQEENGFCLYALQSTLPLLPAKQRPSHPADWMSTDDLVHCPDPNCGLIMRIRRTGKRTLRHDDVSGFPWGQGSSEGS
jgi:uncharacterized repeat protein (TIGR04076 family)